MTDDAITLNDGRAMPRIGLGTWQIPNADAAGVVAEALGLGCRMIDAAAIYGNEAEVGEGVRNSGLPRDAVFITTKVWNDSHGFDAALRAFDASAARLGLDAVDLYLIHWPCPKTDRYVETWRALIRLREEGRARSIGVSNFMPDHLARIVAETGVAPAVNQIEFHPRFQQAGAHAANLAHGAVTQSWTPLGNGAAFGTPPVAAAAARLDRTPAQIVLRWHLQSGLVAIPRSTRAAHLAQNLDIFDFSLTAEEMREISALDAGVRLGPDPLRFP